VLNDRFLAGDTHGNSTAVEAERNSDDALQPTSDVHAIPPHDSAISVGLDGWHLSRVQLDVFTEPQVAHNKRGSHWTVDALVPAMFTSFVGPEAPHMAKLPLCLLSAMH
jgi:hypothetical protein